MEIDLDTIIASVAPSPITIGLDGKKHALRELSLGEVLLLDCMENLPPEQADEFVRSLFVGEAPEVFEQLKKARERLLACRKYVADHGNPESLAALKSPPSAVTAFLLFGRRLPEEIADFPSVEQKAIELATKARICLHAVRSAVREHTPGKAAAAAIKEIDRRIAIGGLTGSQESA
jgi:hypothetical protein